MSELGKESKEMRNHRLAHRGHIQRTDQEKSKPDQTLKQTDIVAFNMVAERAAIDYLTNHIRKKGSPPFNMACALVAMELDVSIETAKRYLLKHSVDHPKAKFIIIDGLVKLR